MTVHRVERRLRHAPEQLFDLVADVERYPEFLPGWRAARIQRHDGETYHTDQIVGVGIFQQRFSSCTTLEHPRRIVVRSHDRAFRHFLLEWTFAPAPEGGCQVALVAHLEFSSLLLQSVFSAAIAGQLESIVRAFDRRARQRYGERAGSGRSPPDPSFRP
ncbi:MAG TPA: type II toxin-antitoxin system RatA family toxin [Geminicoccaceae bacterium]